MTAPVRNKILIFGIVPAHFIILQNILSIYVLSVTDKSCVAENSLFKQSVCGLHGVAREQISNNNIGAGKLS